MQGNIMAASNTSKYIGDDVESGMEKEMLTSGDMFLSVIPGSQSTAHDLGVPFCEEGGQWVQIPAGGPVLPLSPSPQPATFAGCSLCLLLKEGTGQVLRVQSKHSSHHALPLHPSSPSAFSPLPAPASPRADRTWVQTEIWAEINVP